MRQINKQCNYCNQTFTATRKNQIYCSPECRSDVNNDKLKLKFDAAKNIETLLAENKYNKKQLAEATRIVEINYNYKDENEFISFEGKRYKRNPSAINLLEKLGVRLTRFSVMDEKKIRIAIYCGENQTIYLLKSINDISDTTVIYELYNKK